MTPDVAKVTADSELPQQPADTRRRSRFRGHGAKSEAVKEKAILALVSGKTYKAAARVCRVDEKTLRIWASQDDQFKRDLADARRTVFQTGMDRLQALSGLAVDTLAELLAKDQPPTVRLGAARTVTELGLHERDAQLIVRRLEELETLVREQEKVRKP